MGYALIDVPCRPGGDGHHIIEKPYQSKNYSNVTSNVQLQVTSSYPFDTYISKFTHFAKIKMKI